MKTKNIFKTLALAMLMPTMLLTTACSSEDDLVNNTAGESTASTKGYALPVTVNVTRQGDEGTTRATYNESTRTLSFSAGDKLFVAGEHFAVGSFAGTLDYDAVSGKFSGTIYTQNSYKGTAEALLAGASDLMATLVPAGYDTYGYLSIKNEGSYEAYLKPVHNKAFALTKKAAVEQFSVEQTDSYSSGFALAPQNAILNFTISGLTANKEVAVSFDREGTGVIGGNVTTSAEGVATFAVGVYEYCELENCTLTVDGNNFAMPTKTAEAGHVYNISRAVAAAATVVDLSTISGNSYTVTGDVILTGTPTESEFDIKYGGDDYEVTLDNVNSAGSKQVSVVGNNHNLNIKLKGTSRLKDIFTNNGATSGKTVTIGEAAAGGTLILTGSTDPIRAKTFTINGGTVKSQAVTGDNWAVYLNNTVGVLTINGGALYLAAGEDGTQAVKGTVSGTLYGWNGSAWVAYTNQRYATTDNTSGDPTAWTW